MIKSIVLGMWADANVFMVHRFSEYIFFRAKDPLKIVSGYPEDAGVTVSFLFLSSGNPISLDPKVC